MKNALVRTLVSAVLFSLVSSILLTIVGLILGWKNYAQFSDGFFWAGAIFLLIGFVNVMGSLNQPADPRLLHSQSAVHIDGFERYRRWQSDISRGHNLMIFMGVSAVLLFGAAGLAILIGRSF